MNKQIEKMARDLEDYACMSKFQAEIAAKALYSLGYRKYADVAKEIFERLYAHIKYDGHTLSVWKNDLICIAKEFGVDLMKYESEGEE